MLIRQAFPTFIKYIGERVRIGKTKQRSTAFSAPGIRNALQFKGGLPSNNKLMQIQECVFKEPAILLAYCMNY